MTATASVGYSNSLHSDHRTKLVHLIDSPCSSSSLSYMDAAPHRQNDVICLSSPSETSDNEDHDHTYTGSASSVDGSSRPGSDRYACTSTVTTDRKFLSWSFINVVSEIGLSVYCLCLRWLVQNSCPKKRPAVTIYH